MVDFPGLPADEPGARAGGVAPARVRGVRVRRPAAGGRRRRAAGRAAGGAGAGRRRGRGRLPAAALRRAPLLVLRRHGDPGVLLRARGRAAARQSGALRVHHAPAHLRPVAPRRGQVHLGEGGAGPCVRQAGGGDGRDVGRGRGVVGRGRAARAVVRHRPAQRAAGRAHLPRGGLPAARLGRAAPGRLLLLRGAARALLLAPALVRRVAHQHHARPRARLRARARPRARAAHPHGDRVLSARRTYL